MPILSVTYDTILVLLRLRFKSQVTLPEYSYIVWNTIFAESIQISFTLLCFNHWSLWSLILHYYWFLSIQIHCLVWDITSLTNEVDIWMVCLCRSQRMGLVWVSFYLRFKTSPIWKLSTASPRIKVIFVVGAHFIHSQRPYSVCGGQAEKSVSRSWSALIWSQVLNCHIMSQHRFQNP